MMTPEDEVLAVRATADSALASKASCVRLGYFADEFVTHFLTREEAALPRRSPLIHRGYFARVAAFRQIVDEFIAATEPADGAGAAPDGAALPRRQIISLGAGLDTAVFGLAADGRLRAPAPADGDAAAAGGGGCGGVLTAYYEVDYSATCRKKAQVVSRTKALSAHMHAEHGGDAAARAQQRTSAPTVCAGGVRVSARHWCGYHLVGCDMSDMAALSAALVAAGLRFDVPTLIIAECVLVYMRPDDSNAIVEWAGRSFGSGGGGGGCVFALYEQVHPDDAFGRMMKKNIATRGCALLGLDAHPTLDAQRERLLSRGFSRATAHDMMHVYARFVEAGARAAAERLEMFDEFEEWTLMLEHYCIAMAAVEPGPGRRLRTPLSRVGLLAQDHVSDAAAAATASAKNE